MIKRTAGLLISSTALVAVGIGAVSLNAPAIGQERSITSAPVLRHAEKLDGDLGNVLLTTPDDDWVRVVVVMKEQADRNRILDMRRPGLSKAQRRAQVTSILKDVARRSQGPLLDFLRAEQAKGNVGETIRPLWIHNVIGVNATPETILQIAARDDVDYIHHDPPRGAEVLTEDEGAAVHGGGGTTAGIECGVDLMDADLVWNDLNITGNGVVVGVIDTGLCLTHPDIVNQIWNNPGEIPNNNIDDDGNGYVDDIHGWNFENNDDNIGDNYGHGSHVSGTVAGDGTGGTQCGMAPDAGIMVLRFWNNFSGEQSVWDGMQYGVENGADILTASLGWPHSMNPDRVIWRTVCENAIQAGVVVIYAAGNEGCFAEPDNVRTPGDVPDVLTVGATDCADAKASFSSCGPITWEDIPPYNDCPYPPGCIKPDVAAPGVSTTSHSFCSGYTQMSGTSMATPHVAGAVALILEANPDLDHFDVKQILEDTAVDLGPSGRDNQYGSGRVNAYEAVLAAGGITPSCMNLKVENLVAGQSATFTVSKNLTRGETVAIVWGTGGNQTVFDNFAGYCATFGFDIPKNSNALKRIVAQGFVGQDNQFVAKKNVPSNLAGFHVLFQAAKKGTCPDECVSNVADEVVQ